MTVLAAILFCYLLFGCFMDSLSMILLTIPTFYPIVSALDYGRRRKTSPSGSAFSS
ncbi:MAG: hypothetical protein R3D03_14475 [Geminicoccaceae bacterium]